MCALDSYNANSTGCCLFRNVIVSCYGRDRTRVSGKPGRRRCTFHPTMWREGILLDGSKSALHVQQFSVIDSTKQAIRFTKFMLMNTHILGLCALTLYCLCFVLRCRGWRETNDLGHSSADDHQSCNHCVKILRQHVCRDVSYNVRLGAVTSHGECCTGASGDCILLACLRHSASKS